MPKMSHNKRHAMARKSRHGESVMTWQGYFDMVRTSRHSKTVYLCQECHAAARILPQKEHMATARIVTLWHEQPVNPLCKVSSLGDRNDTARTWHVTFCHGMLCQSKCTWPQIKEHATTKVFSYKHVTTRMSYIDKCLAHQKRIIPWQVWFFSHNKNIILV